MAKAALILLRDQIEDIRRGDVRMHPAAEPAVCRGDDAPAPCQIACDRTNWTTVLGHSRCPSVGRIPIPAPVGERRAMTGMGA